MTAAEAEERFGRIQDGVWEDKAKHCVLIPIPNGLSLTSYGKSQRHIYCNRAIAAQLTAALESVVRRGLSGQLKTFDGCVQVRDVRGIPGHASKHSWGLAVDFNAAENPLGGPSSMGPDLVACFTDEGFVWGGTFSRCDGMHFELAS